MLRQRKELYPTSGIGEALFRMHNSARTSTWLLILLELLLLDFELGLFYSDRIVGSQTSLLRNLKDRLPMMAILGTSNIVDHIKEYQNFAVAWIPIVAFILLGIISILTVLKAITKKPEEMTQDEIKAFKLPRFLPQLIYYYDYMFYIISYYFVSVVICTQVRKELVLVKDSTLVVQLVGQVQEEKSKLVYEERCSFDHTLSCTSAPYFFLLGFSIIAMCLALFLKYLQAKLLSFYPDPRIANSKRNNLDLMHQFATLLLVGIERVIAVTRSSKELLGPFYLGAIVLYTLLFMLYIYGNPFYNRTYKIARSLRLLGMIAYLLVLNVVMYLPEEKGYPAMLRQFPVMIMLMLAATVLVRSMLFCYSTAYTSLKGLDTKKKLRNSTVASLLYCFEEYVIRIQTKGAQYEHSTDDILIARLFQAHQNDCTDPRCLCKLPKSGWRGVRSLSNMVDWEANNVLEFFIALESLVNQNLEVRVKEALRQGAIDDLEFLRHWTMFQMRHSNQIRHAIELYRPDTITQEKQMGSVFRINKQKVAIVKSIELGALRDILEHRLLNSLFGETLLKPSECRPHLRGSSHQSLVFYPCVKYLKDLEEHREKIKQISRLKSDALSSLSSSPTVDLLFQNTKDYYELMMQIDGKFRSQIRADKRHLIFSASCIHLFYLRYLKEDYVASKKLVGEIGRKGLCKIPSVMHNFGTDLAGNNQALIVGVSGEKETIHKIFYGSSNIADFGFKNSELLGKDLDALLPNHIRKDHRLLFDHKKYPAERSLESNQYFKFNMRDKQGSLLEARILYRLTFDVDMGIRYIGFIITVFKDDRKRHKQVVMIANEEGVISDLSIAAQKHFKLNTHLREYNKGLGNFIDDYLERIYREELKIERKSQGNQEEKTSFKTTQSIKDLKTLKEMTWTIDKRALTEGFEITMMGIEGRLLKAKLRASTYIIYKLNKVFITVYLDRRQQINTEVGTLGTRTIHFAEDDDLSDGSEESLERFSADEEEFARQAQGENSNVEKKSENFLLMKVFAEQRINALQSFLSSASNQNSFSPVNRLSSPPKGRREPLPRQGVISEREHSSQKEELNLNDEIDLLDEKHKNEEKARDFEDRNSVQSSAKVEWMDSRSLSRFTHYKIKLMQGHKKSLIYSILLAINLLLIIGGCVWETVFKNRYVKSLDHSKVLNTIAFNLYSVANPIGYLNQMRMAAEGLMDKDFFLNNWGHTSDIFTQIPLQYVESGIAVGNQLYVNEMAINYNSRNLTNLGLGQLKRINYEPLGLYVENVDTKDWELKQIERSRAVYYGQELGNYMYNNPLTELSPAIGPDAGNAFTMEGMTRWNYLNPFVDTYFKCKLFSPRRRGTLLLLR